MEQERKSREEIVLQYRNDVEKLLPYITWLQTKSGKHTQDIYAGDGLGESSIAIPVYDANLLRFVKEASKLQFVDRNYVYIYSKYGFKTAEDEKKAIAHATIQDMNMLSGILSKYILRGMTKGQYWTQAVENHVFLEVILKMKDLMEFWDKPLA